MTCSSNVAKCEQNCIAGGCDFECSAKECKVNGCPWGECKGSFHWNITADSHGVRAGLGITNFLFWAFAIVGRFL